MGAVVIVPAWWLLAGFWVQCAIGTAVIAKLNGRALGPWFGWGLALGVLAVVAAVLAGPAELRRETDRGQGLGAGAAVGIGLGLLVVTLMLVAAVFVR